MTFRAIRGFCSRQASSSLRLELLQRCCCSRSGQNFAAGSLVVSMCLGSHSSHKQTCRAVPFSAKLLSFLASLTTKTHLLDLLSWQMVLTFWPELRRRGTKAHGHTLPMQAADCLPHNRIILSTATRTRGLAWQEQAAIPRDLVFWGQRFEHMTHGRCQAGYGTTHQGILWAPAEDNWHAAVLHL